MANTAKRNELEELHELLAECFMDEIRQCREDKKPIDAAKASVIRQFLKDNEIFSGIEDETLNNLKEEFKDELAEKRAQKENKLKDALSGNGLEDLLN